MRRAVASDSEFDARAGRIPVPVLGVGIGLDAVASYVEPDRRIEGGVLAQQDVREFVVEGGAVFWRLEIALRQTPVADGLSHASDQGAHSTFALRGTERSMQIFAGHNISGGHRPVFRDFDVFLLEDGVALGVRDQGGALLPFDFVIGRHTKPGKEAAETEARGFLAGGGGVDRGRDGLGGYGGSCFYLCHFSIFFPFGFCIAPSNFLVDLISSIA